MGNVKFLGYIRRDQGMSTLVVYNGKSFDGLTRFGITKAYRARAAKRMSKEQVSLNVGETFRAKLSTDIRVSRRLFGRQTSQVGMV